MKNFVITCITVVCLFCLPNSIGAQIVISKPILGFTQACASPSFNEYNVTFSFSPAASVSASNQFSLELSDTTGDFSEPSVIYTSNPGEITTSPATITFALPETVAGEAFKIRVKSSAPVASSTPSNAFAAYYKIQDTPFSINNLIETGVFCAGGSYLLTIDNPGNDENDSPLQYPSLTFNWYRETSATTSVFVASGASLEVTEEGTYFVRTNYGTCTSNSYSNRVTVTESSSMGTSEINSSRGNPFCMSEGPTTLSAVNGNTFQWYKDGEVIEGAISQNYETDLPGEYSVDVSLGNCNTSASITLENLGFTSSIDVDEYNTISDGETLLATVTTDAESPVFEWYLNDVLISGATSNSYEATQQGDYRVVVIQDNGCYSTTEYQYTISEPYPDVENIPNVISPNNDGVNDTWVIPQQYVSGSNAEITILTSRGEIVLKTTDYQNNWPTETIEFTSVNPVYYYIITTETNQTKKGSITVVK